MESRETMVILTKWCSLETAKDIDTTAKLIQSQRQLIEAFNTIPIAGIILRARKSSYLLKSVVGEMYRQTQWNSQLESALIKKVLTIAERFTASGDYPTANEWLIYLYNICQGRPLFVQVITENGMVLMNHLLKAGMVREGEVWLEIGYQHSISRSNVKVKTIVTKAISLVHVLNQGVGTDIAEKWLKRNCSISKSTNSKSKIERLLSSSETFGHLEKRNPIVTKLQRSAKPSDLGKSRSVGKIGI